MSFPYTFVFLRHGESFGNTENYFQGRSDTSLTERGQGQIRKLTERWSTEKKSFDKIISSPLTRARITANAIGTVLSAPVEIDKIWVERDTGKLTQVDRNKTDDLPFFHDFYTPFDQMGETGEGDWDLYLRACAGIGSLVRRPPGSYLVVSHGGLLNQVMRAISGVSPQPNTMGVQFRFDNTGFTTVTYDPSSYRWTIISMNDTHHLDALK
jgi:broad specificity phosphatase PhoE